MDLRIFKVSKKIQSITFIADVKDFRIITRRKRMTGRKDMKSKSIHLGDDR